jgi:hypothetical protein
MTPPSRRAGHRVGRRTSRGLVQHRVSRDPTRESRKERPAPASDATWPSEGRWSQPSLTV